MLGDDPAAVTVRVDMEVHTCPVCGVVYYMPTNLVTSRRQTGEPFFCPNGHNLHFTGDTVPTLREKLKKAEEENARLKKENIGLLSRIEQLEAKVADVEK